MSKKRFFDEHIGDALKRYLSSDNKKLSDRYLESKIKSILETKFGTLLGSYTSNVRFNRGVLLVTIQSAPFKNELLNGKKDLINLLNEVLKDDYVKDIRFS
jgi:hypothetical protein